MVEAEHNLTYDLSRNYQDIPGGAAIEGELDTGVENGTLCAPFYSNEYGIGWTTAGHVVKKEDGAGNNAVSQDNGDSADPFGVSRDGYWKKKELYNSPYLDYAFVEKQQDEGTSQWITSADGGEREFELTGIVTNEELENKVGENYTLKGQGRTTGRRSGTLEKTAGNGTQAIETDWEPEDGDSGGPIFYTPNSDEAYIAGILSGYVDSILGGTHAKSTTAETTEVELDGYFLWS